ncbi:AraC family transcriptional regulator [Pacificibacter marinus]|uniref:Transcriptional activator FtrA n=1 Tax=Pacificibacter marinus TaxID=658057 RepID=A0A1Y5RDC4_9RHOB|nr:AraC family transcriptional regulator [Pacificibacter marinus]SEK22896.1 AraC-type DNA-binding protein [Pacificibacter marinus]SLN14774.1 transcriptional activator FtrA [Pacificibacter marinus]
MNSTLTFSSGRFEDAEAHLSQSFCRHRLVPFGMRSVEFSHVSASLGKQAFNTLSYGSEIEVQANGFEDFYMFEMPLRGGVDIAIGQQQALSLPGRALFLSPGQKFRSRWRPDTYQWMLQISQRSIQTAFEARAHRRMSADIVFDPVVELATAHGKSLTQAMRGLAHVVDRFDSADTEAFQRKIDTVVDLLISNLPYFRDGSPVPERLYATPRHVHLAVEILRGRFHMPVAIADVAQDVGVSERALYDGFQRYYQKPPYEVLMRIRMDAARHLIRTGNLPLSDVAKQVGMPHQSRFSGQYRKTFGVLPLADRRRGFGLKE